MDLSSHKLLFSEEFDALNISTGSKTGWNTDYHWGDRYLGSEQQVYVDPDYRGYGLNPFGVSDGILTITAQKAPVGFVAPPNFKHAPEAAYVSGLLNSEEMFSVQYGYFEIRAEMPAGKGLWPAFWLLQSDGNWPAEYDIVEVLGHDTDTLHASSHYIDADGKQKLEHKAVGGFDSADGFHTYGFDWNEETVAWYYDGVKVFEAANRVFDQSMYMLVNLAVGGGWPGKPNATTPFPAEMKIDYVRVYQAPVEGAIVVMPADWAAMSLADFSTLDESAVKNLDWKTARASWDYSVKLEGKFTAIQMMNDWANYVVGNDRDNYIGGASGKHNELDGGKGNDVYKGGLGLDIFVLRDGDGNDRVLDFSNVAGNTDKLKLVGFHFTHFDELSPFLTQTDTGVLLRLDVDQAVFLDKVTIADLKPEQFIFVDSVDAPAGAQPVDESAPPEVQAPAAPAIRFIEASDPSQAGAAAGSAGIDTVNYSGSATLTLAATIENVVSTGRGAGIEGNGLDNRISASGEGYHKLRGHGGDDDIRGGDHGNDLSGGAGNDRLEGGRKADFFWGGSEDDVFVFAKGTISKSGARDQIGDFEGAGRAGGDFILFDDFGPDASLRFSSYHQTYDSTGKRTGQDETKQYYNVYDEDGYNGTIFINIATKLQLFADDYGFA